jgi:hypothetical protein
MKQQQSSLLLRSSINNQQRRGGGLLVLPVMLIQLLLALLVTLYILATISFAFYDPSPYVIQQQSSHLQRTSVRDSEKAAAAAGWHHSTNTNPHYASNEKRRGTYKDWKELAAELARLPAYELLQELRSKDPFGTRTFEDELLQEETKLGRILQHDEIQALFPCPGNDNRISFPDQRNLSQAANFRNNLPGTFLFFQHLRKA